MNVKRAFLLASHVMAAVALAHIAGSAALAADHTATVDEGLAAVRKQAPVDAEKLFKKDLKDTKTAKALLARYEVAGFYRLAGDLAKSRDYLDQARAVEEDYEGRAKLSGRDAAREVGAAFSNDKATIYKGTAPDKTMSHTVNALNRLFLGDREGAYVEIRKALEYQQFERERHDKLIAKAEQKDDAAAESDDEKKEREQEASAKDMEAKNPKLAEAFADLGNAVKDVRNSYENPFTYYLAAVMFHAEGPDSLNEAWVNIKAAHDLVGDVPAVQDLYRQIARQQFKGDPDGLRAAIGEVEATDAPEADSAEVVVLFEDGVVARKEEVTIPLVVPNGTNVIVQNLSFATYGKNTWRPSANRVDADGLRVDAAPVASITKLQMKAFDEAKGKMITRAIIRATTKGLAQNELEKKGGIFGSIVGKLATNLPESADLRAWYTLPDNIQVARLRLSPGPHTLNLNIAGTVRRVDLQLEPGKTILVDAQQYRDILNIWSGKL
mgnify:CR=1 FL=1